MLIKCDVGEIAQLFLKQEEDENPLEQSFRAYSMTLLANMHQLRRDSTPFRWTSFNRAYVRHVQCLFEQLCINNHEKNVFRLTPHSIEHPADLLDCLRDVYDWNTGQTRFQLETYPVLIRYTVEGVILLLEKARHERRSDLALIEETFCFLRDHFFPYVFDLLSQ